MSIIERAKKTNPFAYIVKPFEERELFTNIELAIFKHETELKLKESERKYRELSESIQQIIIEFDVNGIINYLNEPGMQMLGITESELKNRMSITRFIGSHGFEQIRNRINRQSNNSNQKFKRELEVLNMFGKHSYMDEYLTPVYVQSQLSGYRGLLIDITSKKLKENLYSLYNKTASLFDELRVNPFDIIDFLLTEFKRQFYYIEEIYFSENASEKNQIIIHKNGQPKARPYGNSHSEYVISSKRPLYLRGVELDAFNSLHNIEIHGAKAVCWFGFPIAFQNKTYGVFVFQSFRNENALVSSDFENLVVFFDNINSLLERISYLKAIQKSEEKFKHLVNSINEGLIQLDLYANITYVNKHFCSMLGYIEEEIINKNLFDAVMLTADDIDQINYHLTLSKNGIQSQYEASVQTKDGRSLSLLVNSSPFTNNAGAIIGSLSTIIDITEKKEFQRTIRESEQKFRAIFEQAAVGVAIVRSKSGKILNANKKYSEIMGYALPELLALRREEFTHPDDLRVYLSKMNEILCGEISEFSMEKRHFMKGGATVWTNLTISPLWHKGEEPTSHIAIIEDITNRKMIEMGLLKSEQEKENILKSMPDSFLVISRNGTILNSYCNKNENVIKRVRDENINGQHIKDVLRANILEKVGENIQTCFKTNNLILDELEFIHKKRRNFFEIRAVSINTESVLIIIRNVTSIRNNISELQKFYNITEQTKELIMITDRDGLIEYVNPSFTTITGYTIEELKGKNPSVFKSNSHSNAFYKNIWDTILKGESIKCNIVNYKKNGKHYVEEKIISPLYNDANEITHFISTGKDVTEELKREKKIRTYEKFEKILEKKEQKYRTFSLIQGQENERKRIAREIHDGLGQLLTVASANLNAIDLQNIKNTQDKNKIEIVNQMVAEIIQESRRISHNLSPVGLYEFGLEAILKQFEKRIKTNFRQLDFSLKSNLKQKRFSNDIEINLYRIIQETVQNSLKHSKATKIAIHINYRENLLKLVITDNGIGFDYKQIYSNNVNKHLNGIKNIEERAKIIDAKLNIITETGKGFQLDLTLKIKKNII